ncbi:hypothetical protein H9P43_003270 [Blastocladiella emersonii ATCC 22665]|nr:hypothetical protein H9P43_003270 [Blastocladiella emersonii ATCC 22665]
MLATHSLRETLQQANRAVPPRRERAQCANLLAAAKELVDVLDPKYSSRSGSAPPAHSQTLLARRGGIDERAHLLIMDVHIELTNLRRMSPLRYMLHRKAVRRSLDRKAREIIEFRLAIQAELDGSAAGASAAQGNLDAVASAAILSPNSAPNPLAKTRQAHPLRHQLSLSGSHSTVSNNNGGGANGVPLTMALSGSDSEAVPLNGATTTTTTATSAQDATKALSQVIALSNDHQFLLSLRKDETCPVHTLLDVLEVINAGCPAVNPKKRAMSFGLSVESACPPEPYPDHLDEDEMQKRVQQIVNTPSVTLGGDATLPRGGVRPNGGDVEIPDDQPTPLPAQQQQQNQHVGGNRISGIFDSFSVLSLNRTTSHDAQSAAIFSTRFGASGHPLPSLSRISTVAVIMEQNFNPANSANSSVSGGKPRARTFDPAGLTLSPALSVATLGSSPPDSMVKQRPKSMSAAAAPSPTLAASDSFETNLPSSFGNGNGNRPAPLALAAEAGNVGSGRPSPTGSLSRFGLQRDGGIEPRYPSANRSVMVLPSGGAAGSDRASEHDAPGATHWDTCQVCHLVRDHSYAKYIQLAVLYHENNDLEQSYHCLTHAVEVADAAECPVPTPYFLIALYLRHGWGVQPELASSFRFLLLALEYAVKHVLTNQLAAAELAAANAASPVSEHFAPPPAAANGNGDANGLDANEFAPPTFKPKRTAAQEYMATFRDSPLPRRASDIESSPARMGVAMILYELAVSLRYGWGTRGNSRLAKALVTLAANLGDVQSCVEVGTRLARRAHRVAPVAAVKGTRRRNAVRTRAQAIEYLRYAAKNGAQDAFTGWALSTKYDEDGEE